MSSPCALALLSLPLPFCLLCPFFLSPIARSPSLRCCCPFISLPCASAAARRKISSRWMQTDQDTEPEKRAAAALSRETLGPTSRSATTGAAEPGASV